MFGLWPQKIDIARGFDCTPQDLAIAFKEVAMQRYGEKSLIGAEKPFSIFHPLRHLTSEPIIFVSIKTGYAQEAKGVQGLVRITHDTLSADCSICPDGAVAVYCLVKIEHRKEAEHFIDAIQLYLDAHSVYKGKAIRVFENGYDFLDLSGININQLVYNEETLESLRVNLWTIIEQPERCAKSRIIQRKVLLVGKYGAGKTVTALVTAKKAIENNWTFIYLPPTGWGDRDAIPRAFEAARKYQPSVIFIEDIDHEQRFSDTHSFKRNIEQMDGLLSKNDRALVIMSANRIDKIGAALLRPGRTDAIIELGNFTAREIQKLITGLVQLDCSLSPDINWEEVAKHCQNYSPVFIQEIAQRVILGNGKKGLITQELLIRIAIDLQTQHKACDESLGFHPHAS